MRVAGALPPEVVTVAESGIRGEGDLPVLREAGFAAVLVGESPRASPDPEATGRGLNAAG